MPHSTVFDEINCSTKTSGGKKNGTSMIQFDSLLWNVVIVQLGPWVNNKTRIAGPLFL